MGAFLLSQLRGTNVKLINEKNSLHITVRMPVNPSKLILLLIFLRTSYNSIYVLGLPRHAQKYEWHGCGLQEIEIYHIFV